MTLSACEFQTRTEFYKSIFGDKKFEWVQKCQYGCLWPVSAYDLTVATLRKCGFQDPHHVVVIFPAILSYTFENIKAKLEGLKERGFVHPEQLLEAMPGIFGCSFKNIDWKMRLARGLGADVHTFLKYNKVFATMSPKHYAPLLRVCRSRGEEPTPRNIWRAYAKKLHLKQ